MATTILSFSHLLLPVNPNFALMEKPANSQKNRTEKLPAAEEENTEMEGQLLKSLPADRNSAGKPISFYQGFWCHSTAISSLIALQRHFQARDADLIVTSCPKSGTTWLRALVFAIANRIKYTLAENPLLFNNPHSLVPSLELQIYKDSKSPDLESIPSPRIFGTHLPFDVLPSSVKSSKCRIVYISRNPLDQFISYWRFGSTLWSHNNYSISLEESFDKFCSGVSAFGPFWDHVLGYWKASQEMPDKVLFLRYEDLKEDIVCQTKLLAEFLGFPFSEEEEMEGLVEEVTRLCSFENLKELEVNKTRVSGDHSFGDFFREAKVGDWSNYLTPPMAERMKKLIQEKFEGSGLTFKMS